MAFPHKLDPQPQLCMKCEWSWLLVRLIGLAVTGRSEATEPVPLNGHDAIGLEKESKT